MKKKQRLDTMQLQSFLPFYLLTLTKFVRIFKVENTEFTPSVIVV